MCGIAGFLTPAGCSDDDAAQLARMTARLAHRGPDGGGTWLDRDAGIGLGHRRLAVVDLSAAGAQPMHSRCGRYVLVYNGEVYNAEELRRRVGDRVPRWRGSSDTEALLEHVAAFGLDATLPHCIGMFAFALYDRRRRRLVLVRDRLGIKPLFYAVTRAALLFGSELVALLAHPDCPRALDRASVASYLRHGYVPAPHGIFDGVRKLLPGELLEVDATLTPRRRRYWTLDDAVAAGRRNALDPAAPEAAREQLEALLADAVRRRLVADVPLGAFLSGGYDSSTVTALMQAQSSRPVRTFSIGSHDSGYDEGHHARAVAAHLGCEHTELYVTPEEARAVIPSLPEIWDEPFADSSQIPTLLVSRMTREHVTVALSGDGGDELFCGYARYLAALGPGRWLFDTPRALRRAAAAALTAFSPGTWDTLARPLPASLRPARLGDKLHKLGSVLPLDADGYYRRLVSRWQPEDGVLPGVTEQPTLLGDPAIAGRVPDRVNRMQYLDTLTYLPDDILTKVDRASMAVSLEARVPLLDHRLVEFAWRLPRTLRFRDGQGKWLLRQVLYRHVPRALVDRPKAGFAVPIGDWLRGPLAEWAEDLLSEQSLRDRGLLEAGPVRRAWHMHRSGRRNLDEPLWTVLMLEAWCRRWCDAGRPRAAAARPPPQGDARHGRTEDTRYEASLD